MPKAQTTDRQGGVPKGGATTYAISPEILAGLRFSVPASPRSQDRSVQSRARILAVAGTMFLEQGYHGVSTYDIAAAAGVTQSLITYHFKSKEGVWQASMDSLFASFRNGLATRLEELQGSSEIVIITRFISYISKGLSKTPAILRVMMDAGSVGPDHREWLTSRHVRPTYEVAHHLFEVGQKKGILRDHPIANLYYIVFAAGSVFSLRDEIASVARLDAGSASFEAAHRRCLFSMLLTEKALASLEDDHVPRKIAGSISSPQG